MDNWIEQAKQKINLCTRPWTDLHIMENGNITPCCLIHDYFYKGQIDKYFTKDNKYLEKLKSDFMANKKPAICDTCWKTESGGLESHRTIISKKEFKDIHLRLSDKCNFKCFICSPLLSSAIRLEQFKDKTFTEVFADTEKLSSFIALIKDRQNLSLTMSGGEPFISGSHLKLLLTLIEAKQTRLELIYNSNLSTLSYKGFYLPDLWKNFNTVTVIGSCDGYGKPVEYSRLGFNWIKFEKHIKELYKAGINLEINCVLSIFSVFTVPELLQFAEKYNITVRINLVNGKEDILSPKYLPQDFKSIISKKYSSFELEQPYNKDLLKRCIDFVFTDIPTNLAKEKLRLFKVTVLRKDKLHNINFIDYNPELKDLFEGIVVS